jgi:aspartate dehydrogenase
MAKKLTIGIIGCGAIGNSLASSIKDDLSKVAVVSALYDVVASKAIATSRLLVHNSALAVSSLTQLFKRSQLVIECARAQDSFSIARKAVLQKKDIIVMSVGGLIGGYQKLFLLAKKRNVKVYIPSGALCGIDGLKAAGLGKIRSVTLTTYKNPASFLGNSFLDRAGIDLAAFKKERVLFAGSAAQAVARFPQNINVAAVVSLAAIGPARTTVRIIASPFIHKNIHELKIVSDAATITTRTENIPHPCNRKTSFLAVLSAIATLKQIVQPVRIGT